MLEFIFILISGKNFCELFETTKSFYAEQKFPQNSQGQDSHFIIFVSHQWLGSSHPDPKSQQLPVLQEALRNILSGKSTAQSYLASQFFGESRKLTKDELHKLKTGYIWLESWYKTQRKRVEKTTFSSKKTWQFWSL